MDWNNSTSFPALLAASIIMATTFNNQGWTVRFLLLWWKLVKRVEFKINSQYVITLLSYVGQWIQHIICACIYICVSIRSYCTTLVSTHQNMYFTCGRNRPAMSYILRQWKGFLSYKDRRHSSLTVNNPIQLSHHTTKYHFVQHTWIKKNSLRFHTCYYLQLTL
jgi:hypothetical protein